MPNSSFLEDEIHLENHRIRVFAVHMSLTSLIDSYSSNASCYNPHSQVTLTLPLHFYDT